MTFLRSDGGRMKAFALGGLLFCAACASSGPGGLPPAPAPDPSWLTQPQTVPERTEFKSTSTHADVMSFLATVVPRSPYMHLDTMGRTQEGRALPFVVVGKLRDFSPAGVRASGKTVVYVQGNIHGGEVEGKESLQILLRELAAGRHAEWLDSLVLLVAPIYNADGNDRMAVRNRPMQHGPINGMGTRANAQGLNLNRDHMKLDTPEANAMIALLNEYDPHVGMDLHTTNGSIHGYHLTYSAPMHPNTDSAIVKIQREDMFPALSRAVKQKYDWEFYWYGDFSRVNGDSVWSTFEHLASYNNNYLGLRNRFGLLSEAYSYATFEDRIKATNYFLEETIGWAYSHATQIRRMTAAADRANIVGRAFAVRARQERSKEQHQLLVGGSTLEKNPVSGADMRLRTNERRPKMMYEYGTFEPTETETVPSQYIIPNTPELATLIGKLRTHGAQLKPARGNFNVEQFHIDSVRVAARENEGHRQTTVTGAWRPAGTMNLADVYTIDMRQPLARVVFSLLEPRSDDGLAMWGFVPVTAGGTYPIYRVR